MSDTFRELQNALRKAKSHGIDLTTPQGVMIGDKTYPAYSKAVVLDTHPYENGGHAFQIPLENRHKVQFTYRNEGPGKKAYAHSHVLYPTQTGEWMMPHLWGGDDSWGFDQHFPPFDTFHDRLKEYSLEKSRGLRVYGNGWDVQDVPDDELQEHYKLGEAAKRRRLENYPLEADREQVLFPHLIKVHKAIPGANARKWLYDVKTEQLRAWTPTET